MKEIKYKPLYGVALSCILLVLVVLYVAYGVYVPKKQEIENLHMQVTMAKIQQANLRKTPPAKKVLPENKAKLATIVPTDFDQARFLKNVRTAESETAVKLDNITFQDQKSDVPADPTVNTSTNTSTAKQGTPSANVAKKTVLTEQKGHLTVTGDYKQVRQFIDKFAAIGRLVFFDHWDVIAIDKQDPVPLPVNLPPIAPQPNGTVHTDVETGTPSDAPPAGKTADQNAFPKDNKPAPELPSSVPPFVTVSPTAVLGNPLPALPKQGTFKTQVTLDIDFTLYYAPSAKGLLPVPNAIKTYDPTERTNPVEKR